MNAVYSWLILFFSLVFPHRQRCRDLYSWWINKCYSQGQDQFTLHTGKSLATFVTLVLTHTCDRKLLWPKRMVEHKLLNSLVLEKRTMLLEIRSWMLRRRALATLLLLNSLKLMVFSSHLKYPYFWIPILCLSSTC